MDIVGSEYVIGNLVNFSASSANMSVSLYGAQIQQPASSALSMATALAAAGSASVLSNVGTAVYSAFSGTTNAAVLSNAGTAVHSAFSGTTNATVISNAGTLAINNYELSSNTFAGSAVSAIATATSISTKTFSVQARTIFSVAPTAVSVLSNSGVVAVTGFSVAPTSVSVLSNSGVVAVTGFSAAPTQAVVISSVGLGALLSTTLVGISTAVPVFSIQNTGSTFSTADPSAFVAGIMSTGAMPAAITVTSTNVTMSGSFGFQQPWFALIGS